MKIECMIGKGILDKEDCLQCALDNGNDVPCSFDYTLLKYIYSKTRYREKEIHVSDILGCPRSAVMSKTWDRPMSAYKKLIVSFGTLQHEMLEQVEDEQFTAEIIIENEKIGIVGTADVLYKDGRLVDYKTTRNMSLPYLPNDKHIEQLNVYAWILRESGKEVTGAAIQYIDFVGPRKCTKCKSFISPSKRGTSFICPTCGTRPSKMYAHLGARLIKVELDDHDVVGDRIKRRVTFLKKHLDANTIPEEVETGFLCRYCDFFNVCSEGQDAVFVTQEDTSNW